MANSSSTVKKKEMGREEASVRSNGEDEVSHGVPTLLMGLPL